jgi:hypothetical protein
MSILLDIFNELGSPPRITYRYLAKGALRKGLGFAEAAHDAQQEIMQEVGKRFGAERVSVASKIEMRHWNNMKDGAGFKLYFQKGAEPKGWVIPESWGDRQRYDRGYVFMPPVKSQDQAYLQQTMERMRTSLRENFLIGDLDREDEWLEEYGWYHWSRRVCKIYGLGDYHAERLGPGAFVISTSNRIPKYEPPPIVQSCVKLTKRDMTFLRQHPERAERVLSGKNARTIIERVTGFLP